MNSRFFQAFRNKMHSFVQCGRIEPVEPWLDTAHGEIAHIKGVLSPQSRGLPRFCGEIARTRGVSRPQHFAAR